mmetsp:Transcript_14395/g.39288  ORF Transcript_14395/g.39288 Transcript_14395/m.39288 type:complete len:97 (+) Transcript_14395:2723-3013(+)
MSLTHDQRTLPSQSVVADQLWRLRFGVPGPVLEQCLWLQLFCMTVASMIRGLAPSVCTLCMKVSHERRGVGFEASVRCVLCRGLAHVHGRGVKCVV